MSPTAYTSGYKAFDYHDLSGGLNLRDKADAVGDKEAIDLLNVVFGNRGAIDQRDGYVDYTPADLTNRVDSLSPYYNAAGAKQLVAGAGARIDVLSPAGAVVASLTGMTAAGPWNFARFGDPTHEWLFAANGADPVARWDGTAWTTGTALATVNGAAGQAMPRAGAVCVTAMHPGSTSGSNASNRLVLTAFGNQTGTFGGVALTPSRVFLSNPGQPLIFETDGDLPSKRQRNWIDLTPGDGEQILAAVAWRELTFIFKETKFFVVWGETTAVDATGAVITDFQVREIVNAVGLASKMAITVGRDGVYFMNRRGVYITHGDQPDLLSDDVGPMWTQDPEIYFRSSPINLGRLDLARAHWHMERFYLAVPTGAADANDRLLVYDTLGKWWSLHDVPASALASFRPDVRPLLHFGYASGPKRVGRQAPGSDYDRGDQTIISRWRSGFSDYGGPEQITLRETKVWASGAVIWSPSVDFDRASLANIDVLFGKAGQWPIDGAGTWDEWLAQFDHNWPGNEQISAELIRYATRGTVFSTQFSNSPQAPTWSVHRVARHLRETREPSIR